MANPEHVEIVEKGREAIAEWRASHPDERLDLIDADLRRVDIMDAYFSPANVRLANFSRADLSGAYLIRANLRLANLREANLVGTSLDGADLSGADLSGADLSGAVLTGAYIISAHLKDTNVEAAVLRETVLADVDVSGARGLDSVRHLGPSVIDERTLRKSWPLPEVFLRGCGLSDDLIAFYRATLGKAIEFYSCFISYSSKDQDFATRLHADLQDEGVRCWFAPEDMKIGARLRAGIDEAIRLHDKLLLILSEHSVGSQWVEQEVETALERERKQERTVLFPIRLDDAVMESKGGWAALIRNTRNIGDFRRWKEPDAYQKAFERLLRDLKSEPSTNGGTD